LVGIVYTEHCQPNRLHGGLNEAGQEPAVDPCRRGREPVGGAWSVEADQGVEVDDAAALILGHLGVLHGRQIGHAAAGHAESLRDQTAQRDGEPAPQVRRPPLPHDLGGVVVTVAA
jgi:hypothetical protein